MVCRRCVAPNVTPYLAAWEATNDPHEWPATMPQSRVPNYQAAVPPAGATCRRDLCCSVAVVRLTIPRHKFTTDELQNDDDSRVTWDACDLHWPGFRDVCLRSGREIVDETGDLQQLILRFPRWDVWRSDQGRLYASAVLNGSRQGTTVDAYLVGQLRSQMEQAEERADPHLC